MLKSSVILFLVLFSLNTNGQEQDTVFYNLSSPYKTVLTHFNNLAEDSYHPDVAAKTFNQENVDATQAQRLAIKLKQALDGAGIEIEVDHIPKSPNYLDSASNQHKYVLDSRYPDIFLLKSGKKWLYSTRAVNKIPIFHSEIYPFGTARLLDLLPKMGHKKILGLRTWQLVGIFVLVLISFIIHKVFSLISRRVLIQLLHKFGYKDMADTLVAPLVTPVSLFFIFLLLLVFIPVLQLPIHFNKYIMMITRAAVPLFATVVAYNLVNVFARYLERMAEKTRNTLDDQLVPLIRKAFKTFVVIVGGLFMLHNLNFDITALIAGVSIGGLAFALAAQDTLKNFFGSVMIFVDRPFQIGDWITSGSEIDGTVEEVGFRSTRIRTFRNSVTSVPNGRMADATVDNHGLRVYRRFYMKIGLTYDTPPDRIELFVEGLKKIVQIHPKTRKDVHEIYLNEMADFSLNIMFYIFFEVPSWSQELEARQEVLLEIIRLAKKVGVNFAFPTQTLHMETFPEKKGLSADYSTTNDDIRKEMESFFKKSNK